MYKNIIYFNYSSLFSLILITILSVTVGCSGGNKEELKRLTELENKLIANRENLNIDIETFDVRLKQMEKDLNYFRYNGADTVSVEFNNQLSKFNVIRKIYAKYTAMHGASLKAQAELETQLINLRLDLEEGNISKDEFKNYFRQEEIDINELLANSEELNKALYQVEPDFRRIAKLVTERLAHEEAKLPQ